MIKTFHYRDASLHVPLTLCNFNVLITSVRHKFNSFMNACSLMLDVNASVIIVDEAGTAFLAIALPCSNNSNGPMNEARRKHFNLQRKDYTPLKEKKIQVNIVTENTKRQHSKEVNNQNTRNTHEEDKEVVELAIFERKGQLEKDAEQRAEVVFKQWYKEKKTLEQVIDESLRYSRSCSN